MEIRYKFLSDYNLVIQKFKGEFSIDQYKVHVFEIINDERFRHINKSLFDLRETTLQKINKPILDQLIEIRDIMNVHDLTSVFLVDSPNTTVLAHLYIDKIKKKNYKYCSTISKALDLLELSAIKTEIEHALEGL